MQPNTATSGSPTCYPTPKRLPENEAKRSFCEAKTKRSSYKANWQNQGRAAVKTK
ncbi:hypothetical protein [Eikenella halliae]|uniref:hypothetical protein n=1 Tax=Eikenella halliae TaxID=1795832 RepID=UPI000AE5B9CC|nr:hypothetical protein [Eikenella halliae]